MNAFKYRMFRKLLQTSCIVLVLAIIYPNSISALLSGDANSDGKVDGIDFAIWLSHYGQSTSGITNGDFNADNRIDGIDFAIWLSNYGKIAATDTPTRTLTSSPVPTLTLTLTPSPIPTGSGGGITFAGAGDIASCGGPAEATAKQITDLGPNAYAFAAGDNAYASGGSYSSGSCYDRTWGVFKNRTYPVVGTHEVSDGIAGYYSYFGNRVLGPSSKGFYSYDVGSWHILSINSELTGSDLTSQLNWVKSDLAAHPAHCIGAVMHMPRYSPQGGNNTALAPVWDALEDAGAEWTISAHYPLYERTYPLNKAGAIDNASGIVSFRVGTGGNKGSFYPNVQSPLDAKYQVGSSSGFWGILKMNLTSTGYSFQFTTAPNSPNQNFSDSGSAVCH
jgi:hypothetical protein